MAADGSSLSGSPTQSQSAVAAYPLLTVVEVEPPKVVPPCTRSHHDGIIKTRSGSVESLNESCGSSGSVNESDANLYLTGVDNLKKRKAPLPLEEGDEPDYSVSVPVGAAARIICNLVAANMNALLALKNDTTRAAVMAREIVKSQEPLIYYLKTMVLVVDKEFLDKEALMKANSLLKLTDELIPLKKYLPNKYNSLVVKQGLLVLELKRHFLIES